MDLVYSTQGVNNHILKTKQKKTKSNPQTRGRQGISLLSQSWQFELNTNKLIANKAGTRLESFGRLRQYSSSTHF